MQIEVNKIKISIQLFNKESLTHDTVHILKVESLPGVCYE